MKGKILVVDDDVNAQIITETLLETRGWRVRSVCDGGEALEAFRRDPADVVVTELQLPGMNGLELIRQLRGRFQPLPLAAQPRVIVLSSESDPATQAFAMRLGADAFLKKPVVPAEFVHQVEALLQGRTVDGAPLASLRA
ncbi:MAG TPA: response regulator [Candidatus Binatia bacterium]|nr:response regulator [Candidatus Binatia bacterium]